MRSLLFAATLVVAIGHPALASQPASDSSTQARASQGAQEETVDTATGEKVVCRRDKEIGSRVKARRICMTESQWAQRNTEERTFLEQRQAQRTVSGN